MEIANQFVQHWFPMFDDASERPNLASLYRPESMLAWEGKQMQGVEIIMESLTKPELSLVKTRASIIDAAPANGGGMVITVTGELAINDEFDKPMVFTSTFVLQPTPEEPGQYFIYSQIFRLVLL